MWIVAGIVVLALFVGGAVLAIYFDRYVEEGQDRRLSENICDDEDDHFTR